MKNKIILSSLSAGNLTPTTSSSINEAIKSFDKFSKNELHDYQKKMLEAVKNSGIEKLIIDFPRIKMPKFEMPKLKSRGHFEIMAAYGQKIIGPSRPEVTVIFDEMGDEFDDYIDEMNERIKESVGIDKRFLTGNTKYIQQYGRMLRPVKKVKWLDTMKNGLKPGYRNYLVPNKNTLNLKQYIKRLKL